MLSQKHPPCVFSTALAGSGFFDVLFRPVTGETVGRESASKKFRMRNVFFIISMLQASMAHAFTCATISGQTITITGINQVNCAAGEVAFLEVADLTSWQTLLANAVLDSQPFDYVLAGAFWAFAFSFTVGIWFFTKNINLIFEAIKSW